MKSLSNKIIVSFFLLCVLSTNAHAASLCQNTGYIVALFEDPTFVATDYGEQLKALKQLYGEDYKGEKIKYEYFSTVSMEMFVEFTGIYAQKMEELGYDPSYSADQYFELFFFVFKGADGVLEDFDIIKELDKAISGSLIEYLIKVYPPLKLILDSTLSAFDALIARAFVFAMQANYADNILPNYIDHHKRMVTLLTERQKLILVAHSRGSFYANKAYGDTVGKADSPYYDMKKSVGIVYSAPMVYNVLGGRYVLNARDSVINHLRFYFADILPHNTDYSGRDINNHDLLKTYLLEGSMGRLQMMDNINHFLTNLETPPTTGNEGLFTATLTWDGEGDIDLYVNEPTGTRVYFSNKQGDAGYLDVDNILSNGPEHYYASCEEEMVYEGVYSIGANNYTRGNGRIATVQLSTYSGGALSTKSIPVGNACGMNCDIKHFFNVKVAKTESGAVEITVE